MPLPAAYAELKNKQQKESDAREIKNNYLREQHKVSLHALFSLMCNALLPYNDTDIPYYKGVYHINVTSDNSLGTVTFMIDGLKYIVWNVSTVHGRCNCQHACNCESWPEEKVSYTVYNKVGEVVPLYIGLMFEDDFKNATHVAEAIDDAIDSYHIYGEPWK